MGTRKPVRVSNKTLAIMREEAQKNLAQPGHEDWFIANYDFKASVDSRALVSVLDELEFLRKKCRNA